MRTTSFVSDERGTQSGATDPERAAPPDRAVEWRSTAKDLWVGRSGDRHVGVIEHRRGYVVTDADGRPRGSYRSLDAAMASAGTDDSEAQAEVAPAWEGVVLVTTIVGAVAVLLAAYGLTLL